jgi:hypothetical protein
MLLLLCNGCWRVDGSLLKAVCNDGFTFHLLLKKCSHILKYIALLQYCISDCTQTGSKEWYRVVVRENTKMWRGVAKVYIHVALPMYTAYTDMVRSKSTRCSEIIGGHCGHVGLWCQMWFWGIIVDDEGSQQILDSFKTHIRESCGLQSNFLLEVEYSLWANINLRRDALHWSNDLLVLSALQGRKITAASADWIANSPYNHQFPTK